ncbi:MAG: tetratricopeptide repeat protein [Acidobacteriota bacterium]
MKPTIPTNEEERPLAESGSGIEHEDRIQPIYVVGFAIAALLMLFSVFRLLRSDGEQIHSVVPGTVSSTAQVESGSPPADLVTVPGGDTGSDYLALVRRSLDEYNQGNYLATIDSAKAALRFNARGAAAFNNICAAYNSLERWDEAIAACRSALEIDPEFQLARNNLNWAESRRERR